jgi:hypothetical protein
LLFITALQADGKVIEKTKTNSQTKQRFLNVFLLENLSAAACPPQAGRIYKK